MELVLLNFKITPNWVFHVTNSEPYPAYSISPSAYSIWSAPTLAVLSSFTISTWPSALGFSSLTLAPNYSLEWTTDFSVWSAFHLLTLPLILRHQLLLACLLAHRVSPLPSSTLSSRSHLVSRDARPSWADPYLRLSMLLPISLDCQLLSRISSCYSRSPSYLTAGLLPLRSSLVSHLLNSLSRDSSHQCLPKHTR